MRIVLSFARTCCCALIATLGCGLAGKAVAADACDRPCLQGYVDRYLGALVAHDPGRLPWALGARFTENGQALQPGDGLWGTASAPGHYRLYVADPEDGQVGFIGTVLENGTPVLLALRLKIEDQTVSEVETIVARGQFLPTLPAAGPAMEARGQPRAQFLRTVPEKERLTRAELARIANSYFTGLAANSGRNTAPFAASCERLENGLQTTHNPQPGAKGPDILALSCEAQQKSGYFAFVTRIRDRRFPVIDRERGLVLAFAFFEHAGRVQDLHLTTGEVVPSPVRSPSTLEIAELFQIDKGQIDQVEAVLNGVPYGMVSAAWDAR
jgi:hypothetical protein